MKIRNRLAGLAAVAVLLAAGSVSAQEPSVGLVRISDKPAVGEAMKARAHQVTHKVMHSGEQCTAPGECNGSADCQSCQDCEECRGVPCPVCYFGLPCLFHCCSRRNCDECEDGNGCYYNENGELVCPDGKFGRLGKKAACRYGYFRPQGNCGKGLAPFGRYKMVYAANPDYFDPRDGRMYAAQGYGVNVTVPLAPTVGGVYNYGWGVPSSRLTQVSRPVPLQMPVPVQSAEPVQQVSPAQPAN